MQRLLNILGYSVLLFSTCTQAGTLEITPNLYYFNYEEFSPTGKSLDKEQGILPGVRFKYSHQANDVTFSPFISFNGGTIDYIGSTQAGDPHNTRTIENIISIGLDLTLKPKSGKEPVMVFGLRHWQWDRDILTVNNVRGLHELYSWSELSAGLYFETENYYNSFYTAKFSVFQIFNPQMKIYLENSSETLDLGESPGVRLVAGKTWLQQQNRISLNFIAEYWQFGRSNSIFTNDFFGSSVFITEPESESFHTGIELSYRTSF